MRAGVRAASPAGRRHRVCRIRAARQFISILPHFPRGWDTKKLTSTICGRVQLLSSAETVTGPRGGYGGFAEANDGPSRRRIGISKSEKRNDRAGLLSVAFSTRSIKKLHILSGF